MTEVPSTSGGSRDPAAALMATLAPPHLAHKVGVITLALVSAWGLACYGYQLKNGLAVTAMNNYFSWGVYIINFVFFIGISMAGTLISAMLRLTNAEWRRPITRMAEGITLFALLVAGPMVIIDMGRPDRILHIFLYGRVQSPILWDVMSLTTYLAGSALYLYLPMIPDLAIMRDQGARFSPWRRWLYGRLALGWKGTSAQHRVLERAISVMAIVIIPVAVSIHTVTAWIFGMTLRPGWHSSIIGPDFVVGALFSGIAAVIVAMAMFRKFFRLEAYLTPRHFRNLGLMLLVAGVAYLYFTVNNFVGSSYVTQTDESGLLHSIFGGQFEAQFWTMITVGIIAPCMILAMPWTRTIAGIVTASVLVNIGMWIMRFVIVVPTLSSPFLPLLTLGERNAVATTYLPTFVEWSITAGAFSGFALLYILFSKVFPIISIWELEGAAAGE